MRVSFFNLQTCGVIEIMETSFKPSDNIFEMFLKNENNLICDTILQVVHWDWMGTVHKSGRTENLHEKNPQRLTCSAWWQQGYFQVHFSWTFFFKKNVPNVAFGPIVWSKNYSERFTSKGVYDTQH